MKRKRFCGINSIIIYGTGEVAKKFYYYISELTQITVKFFIVTEGNDTEFLGRPVYQLADVENQLLEGLIVIASTRYGQEMLENLNSRGLNEYYLLNKHDVKSLNEYLRKKRYSKLISYLDRMSTIKYILFYWIDHNFYFKSMCKKKIRFCLGGNDIFLRLYSMDFEFFESIFVGEYDSAIRGFRGEYDLDEAHNFDGCLDLGANIGLFSILYALKYPEKRIVALEPEGDNFSILEENTKQYTNIVPINAGVWEHDTYCHVCPGRVINEKTKTCSEGSFYIEECKKDDNGAIECFSVKSMLSKHGFSRALVKMDIEGTEKEIFESSDVMWIKDCQLLFVETHEWLLKNHIDELVNKKMMDAGFKCSTQGENKVFIREKA